MHIMYYPILNSKCNWVEYLSTSFKIVDGQRKIFLSFINIWYKWTVNRYLNYSVFNVKCQNITWHSTEIVKIQLFCIFKVYKLFDYVRCGTNTDHYLKFELTS